MRSPVTFAVTVKIKRDRPPSLGGHGLGRLVPGVPRLTAAKEEEHGPRVGLTVHVSDEAQSLKTLVSDPLNIHEHIVT